MNQSELAAPWYIGAWTSARSSGFHVASWGLCPLLPASVEKLRSRQATGTAVSRNRVLHRILAIEFSHGQDPKEKSIARGREHAEGRQGRGASQSG
jgi:hypothetical protein